MRLTLSVSVSYAQRVESVIEDNRRRAFQWFEKTSTNAWTFFASDREEAEDIAGEATYILEAAGIPETEYDIEY